MDNPIRGGAQSKFQRHPQGPRADWLSSALDTILPGTRLKYSDLIQCIEQRIELVGRHNLNVQIEQPRFSLLQDACKRRDIFYLHLHSLYCIHSAQPALTTFAAYDRESINEGFNILESVLKTNSGLTKENLTWCANFPYLDFNKPGSEGVKRVATFLVALAQHWTSLHQDIINRHYPFLVDELLVKLQCPSLVMQDILFTASRRRLGVLDGEMGTTMTQLFKQDQSLHLEPNGEFVRLAPQPFTDFQQRNQGLVAAYRDIVAKVKAEQRRMDAEVTRQQQVMQQQI